MALIVIWRCVLGLLGLFGIIGIKLPMNQNVNYQVKFGGCRSFLQDYKGALCALNTNLAKESSRWTPPLHGVFKINVDGVTSEDGLNSSVGAVIRDSCGAVLAACKFLHGHFSVEEVEVLAMEAGILLTQHMKLSQIIIESDAISIVNSINENFMERSIGHLFQGILALLSSFTSWKVNHVNWDYNRVAHELARLARRSEDMQVWRGVLPRVVQDIVQVDCTKYRLLFFFVSSVVFLFSACLFVMASFVYIYI